jgi:hypothetical protein
LLPTPQNCSELFQTTPNSFGTAPGSGEILAELPINLQTLVIRSSALARRPGWILALKQGFVQTTMRLEVHW